MIEGLLNLPNTTPVLIIFFQNARATGDSEFLNFRQKHRRCGGGGCCCGGCGGGGDACSMERSILKAFVSISRAFDVGIKRVVSRHVLNNRHPMREIRRPSSIAARLSTALRIASIVAAFVAACWAPSAAAFKISSSDRPFTITTSQSELCSAPYSSACSSPTASASHVSQSVIRVWTLPLFSFDDQQPISSSTWSLACTTPLPSTSAAAAPTASSSPASGSSDLGIVFDCDFDVPLRDEGAAAQASSVALAVVLQGQLPGVIVVIFVSAVEAHFVVAVSFVPSCCIT